MLFRDVKVGQMFFRLGSSKLWIRIDPTYDQYGKVNARNVHNANDFVWIEDDTEIGLT